MYLLICKIWYIQKHIKINSQKFSLYLLIKIIDSLKNQFNINKSCNIKILINFLFIIL